MRTILVGVYMACSGLLAGCDSSEALDSDRNVVAEAGDHEIHVERLAETVARGAYVPLELAVVERIVELWVDYSLVAQRLAAGDSLLDSASILRTMWRDAQLQLISQYHDDIVSERVAVDAAAIDSVYNAGDHRLIYHILISAPATADPADRETARRKAERLRDLAITGPSGWLRANRENDDSVARDLGGRFGLITRGETLPQFDRVVFSLAPGETSEVTESELGYHIVRRPALDDVRAEFRSDVQDVLIKKMNVGLVAELENCWDVAVEDNAADLMRGVVGELDSDGVSGETLGTYRGGRFTVADLRRWLRALPVEYEAEARNWDDEEMIKFLRGLMRNEVLAREAQDAGYELTDQGFAALRESHAQDLELMRSALGLDSLLQGVEPPAERSGVAADAVEQYLAAVTNDLALLVPVPPFLSEKLRSEMSWGISRTATERALEYARDLRALIEEAERVAENQESDSSDAREENDEP